MKLSLVLELAEKIERAQRALFELDNVLAELSNVIHDTSDLEFVAIQLFNKEERTIQTVHATGNQEGLIGLAKHTTQGDDTILDIQASIFNATPPKIKIISGWDLHFDKLLYEQFGHSFLVRIWIPIIILRDKDGNIVSDWPDVEPWGEFREQKTYSEEVDGHVVPRYNIDVYLDKEKLEKLYGPVFIEKIGTVEAGHGRLTERMTRETALHLANVVAQQVTFGTSKALHPSHVDALPSLRQVSLEYVLETTAQSAMCMLGGKAATLHFCYDELHDRYLYEVASGAIGPHFLANHPPRKNGLGRRAVKDKRALVVPDLAAGQATNHLEIANPPAWALGLRAMAAFPLIVGDKFGVLYVGFEYPRRLTTHEHNVIARFLGRAIQAIRTATYHKDSLDEKRRLINLNAVAQSLVNQRPDPPLLYRIGGTTLNLLAADFRTIHEYVSGAECFLDAAIAGHFINPNLFHIINQHRSAKRLVQDNPQGVVDQPLIVSSNLPEDVREFFSSEGFVHRLGILLRYTEEVFGVLFVYYRRHYKLSPQDRKAIEILAAHAAIAIRIRRSFQEACSQIGHDFNRQIFRLASRLSLLDNEINKAPHVAQMFWNSRAGDLLKGVLVAKEHIARFAIDFQEFGKRIILNREPVDWGDFVGKQIYRLRQEVPVRANAGAWVQRQSGSDACSAADVASRRAAMEIYYDSCSEELVELDKKLIARAIDAVMNNAIQALLENTQADPSAPGRIVARSRRETDIDGRSFAVLSIADNGPGVHYTRKERIFQLFYTTRVNEGGNGIGLANARRYVELHGGTLQEVGTYGEGAIFVFRVPCLPAKARESARETRVSKRRADSANDSGC